MILESILLPLLSVVAILNLILGGVILFHSPRELSSFLYGFVVLGVAVWSIGITGFYSDFRLNFDWIAITHSASLMIAFLFASFGLVYPQRFIEKPKRLMVILAVPLVVVLYLLFYTDEIIGRIVGIEYELNTGYLYYQVLMVFYFTLGFYLLYRQYLQARNETQKKQVIYIFIGAILTASLAIVTNLIFPFVGIFDFTWLGPIFTFFLVVFLAYAILEHHLFSIQVIATELFVFALWITTLIRTIIAKGLQDFLISGFVFIATVLIGIFLIRSVIREVRQREELAVANKGQENLIHIMNHQIKGYLGKNKGIFAELLSGDHGSFNGTAKKYIEEGLRQSTEGVEYVQTILKGASASKGKLEYDMKQVDVSELVHEVAGDQKSSAEKNDLHFEINIADEDFSTTGDASQLKEALRNLIENAINYSDAGGDVEVSLHKEGGNIVFEVKDTGKGIPEEVKPRLFTPGGRSKDATDYNPNTSGFGLAFVKGVVEAHHGRVDYKPNPDGKGTVFFIELPVGR